jgi:hypothetical protein
MMSRPSLAVRCKAQPFPCPALGYNRRMDSDSTIIRQRLLITGVVQGVGFRPFVYGLALRYGLTGFVGNDSGGVFVEIEGDAAH